MPVIMVEIRELAAAGSLVWVHRADLAVFDTFVLFVITSTKAAIVHGVVPKCKGPIFS